jgi:DNA-binding CsgD family transcriptional regulator
VLEALGLSPAEERVYDAIVAGQATTVAELARQISMPRAGVTRAVQSLAAKGLVTRLPGRAVRFSALDPAVAAGTLAQAQEQALRSAHDRMRDLAQLYRLRHTGTHPAEQVEVIDGADNVWNTHLRLVHAAERQVRIFDAPPYLEPHPERENSDERVILGKGVTIRCAYARDGVLVPGRDTHIRAAIRGGEQARVAASLPMKMMICDASLALIPIMPGGATNVAAAYLIHPSSLLDALAALFEAYWSQAVPLDPAALPAAAEQAGQDTVTADDHRILALLAAGATDDAIGRATGRSMRTVQRRIRDLMQMVGAQTRFQLGIAATRRHWV